MCWDTYKPIVFCDPKFLIKSRRGRLKADRPERINMFRIFAYRPGRSANPTNGNAPLFAKKQNIIPKKR